MQSIEDVEDTKDGATMHLQELSELIDQVRGNIQAIHGVHPAAYPCVTVTLVILCWLCCDAAAAGSSSLVASCPR